MAWTTPRTWATGEVVTASIMNTHVRDNLNAVGASTAQVTTSETTTSTSYTDLATSGPAVTRTTGTTALILITAQVANSGAGNGDYVGVAVSGATTAAASDTGVIVSAPVANYSDAGAAVVYTNALNAGSNTFTLKYRVSAGTGTFLNRRIVVIDSPL